jgi:hypothetical protein
MENEKMKSKIESEVNSSKELLETSSGKNNQVTEIDEFE